jgi:DNA-binding HxlR family transcriptional regulator
MKNISTKLNTGLNIHNNRFITYSDNTFTIDILGGIDLQNIERMICTLRITYKNYPPFRTTLDLYNDNQTEKLQRTLCDKWELKLLEVSTTLHQLTLQLETYRLQELKFTGKNQVPQLEISQENKAKAITFLKDNHLIKNLTQQLNTTGILGENENAIILFLALASYKFNNPFSVICLAKSGIGKSYLLQKLAECMPPNTYSFHTRISENALYYFNSNDLNNKALFIEDLEWTIQMLQPLATLQTQGKLINTRATKDKDGMLHSTSFEVIAKLCLIACAYSDKNLSETGLPFLCINLNHTEQQDMLIMEYQKKCKSGLIKTEAIQQVQQQLKNAIATLQPVNIINPFATLINLPEAISYPRKSLLLLLNFIDIITYFFQYQRQQHIDKETGEIFIKTAPQDVELAFKLLKNSLFRKADELSTTARGFYNWLQKFLKEAKTNQFTALDIRKTRSVHPRTLNNYLNELKLFNYIQITGGNKHREGFIYKLTNLGNQTELQTNIEQSLNNTLEQIKKVHSSQQSETSNLEPETLNIEEPKTLNLEPEPPKTEPIKTKAPEPQEVVKSKRRRIEEKEEHTLKILLELEAQQPEQEYLPNDFAAITHRSYTTEARYLKILYERGDLIREWRNRQYYYTLAKTSSKQVSKTPLSNTQNQ